MTSTAVRTVRYVRSWVGGHGDVTTCEFDLVRDGVEVPATLITPIPDRGPLPIWIALHGITRPGRNHQQLIRFTRALAATGCAVLVPEIPEWRELRLAPALTVPTVRAAIKALKEQGDLEPGERVGLVGFSFGSPQAIAAAAHPDIRDDVGGVVGFGGYHDLERAVLFQFTGEHEWNGEVHHLQPDPYGRWIVGANYLTGVPGYEDAGVVAEGLRELAALAGDVGAVAWDPRFDPTKAEIRAVLSDRHRETFDLFAPPSPGLPPKGPAESMAHALAAAARRLDPEIEPGARFAEVRCPVHILHGRHDHLVPSTEAYRLAAALPEHALRNVLVTPLFGHSAQDPLPGWTRGAVETVRFLGALRKVLGLI